MITLDELALEVQELAPLPAAASKLAQLAADPDANVDAVVTTIRFDQALTAAVLRYANSPLSGCHYEIRSVKDAVVRLGFAKVLEIAVSAHVRKPMRRALPEYGLGEEELWTHAAAAALAAEQILHRDDQHAPPLSFTASLLHDIGKLILARHLKSEIQAAIYRLTSDYSMTYYQAEKDVLGFTHAEIGARVVERWGLGEEIVTAVARHHELDRDLGPVTDVVRVSNIVAKTVGTGLGFEGMNLQADAAACERLAIDRDEFERLSADVASRLKEVKKLHS